MNNHETVILYHTHNTCDQAHFSLQLFRGYCDDCRNTDNAWVETVARNFHDEDGDALKDVKLTVSNTLSDKFTSHNITAFITTAEKGGNQKCVLAGS